MAILHFEWTIGSQQQQSWKSFHDVLHQSWWICFSMPNGLNCLSVVLSQCHAMLLNANGNINKTKCMHLELWNHLLTHWMQKVHAIHSCNTVTFLQSVCWVCSNAKRQSNIESVAIMQTSSPWMVQWEQWLWQKVWSIWILFCHLHCLSIFVAFIERHTFKSISIYNAWVTVPFSDGNTWVFSFCQSKQAMLSLQPKMHKSFILFFGSLPFEWIHMHCDSCLQHEIIFANFWLLLFGWAASCCHSHVFFSTFPFVNFHSQWAKSVSSKMWSFVQGNSYSTNSCGCTIWQCCVMAHLAWKYAESEVFHPIPGCTQSYKFDIELDINAKCLLVFYRICFSHKLQAEFQTSCQNMSCTPNFICTWQS